MVTMRQRRRRPTLTLPVGAARAECCEVDVVVTGPRPERRERAVREDVDFSKVAPEHIEIDERLLNWGRWSHGASGEGARTDTSPMFRLHRSDTWEKWNKRREYGADSISIDKHDALNIHFAIVHPTFDPRCREALQWAYQRPHEGPTRTADKLGVSLLLLHQLVVDGRQALVERGCSMAKMEDSEYKIRDNGGETAPCDSCNFSAPTAEFRWAPGTPKHERPYRLLCQFCATTMAGRYTEYPQTQINDQMRAETWRAAACVFNALKFGLDDPLTQP